MLIAEEHLGGVGVGVTTPQFFRATDGNIYVVKLQNNRLGPKVLVNEFIAARLGKILGLCFVPGDIIEISEEILQGSKFIVSEETLLGSKFIGETAVSPGRHYASLYLAGARYLAKDNIAEAVNVKEMAGVILFDHMFHNADRTHNRKNLLLLGQAGEQRIYAIDNSHLFLSGRWTVDALRSLGKQLKVFYRYSFGILLRDRLDPEDFLPYLAKVEKIDDESITRLVGEIPAEWLPDEGERQALVRHIQLRRNLARAIWDKLCKYIPEARGGRRWLTGKVVRLAVKKESGNGRSG